jgi:hypothetical protein
MGKRAQLQELLGATLGRSVKVVETDPAPVHLAAVYVADSGPCATVFCDRQLAAYLGAALALMPAAGARNVGDSLPDTLAENAREVFNIASRVFATNERPCRLAEFDASDEAPKAGEFLKVDLEGYGAGALAIVTHD